MRHRRSAEDLYGPDPGKNSGETFNLGHAPGKFGPWRFLTAATANTKEFLFSLGLYRVARARCRVIWTPNRLSTKARLIAAKSGFTDIIELGRFDSDGARSPVHQAIEFADKWNALVEAREDRHVGIQFQDSGPWVLYGVVLYLYETDGATTPQKAKRRRHGE